MAITYEPIATATGTGSSDTVTFSTISGTYTDLIVVCSTKVTSGGITSLGVRFNSDTGNNYSYTLLQGDGSTAVSQRQSNTDQLIWGITNGGEQTISILHIQNYSNATTYKTALGRGNSAGALVRASVGLWRNTNAITSVSILAAVNFATTSNFTLYGIKAA